jgi:Rrf2 family protein
LRQARAVLDSKRPMLTAKGKYGLKALAHLARLEAGESAQAVEIAQAHSIPKKFLDAILGDLRNSGIVYTKKGPGGGYMLARPAKEINIGHVIRTLDGPLAPIRCASRTAFLPCRDCRNIKKCIVRITMTKVRDAISDVLDAMTLAEMTMTSDANGIGLRPKQPSSGASRSLRSRGQGRTL